MFIEVSIAHSKNKHMVNVRSVVDVYVDSKGETTLIFINQRSIKVKESYDWVSSFLPKYIQTNQEGYALTLEERTELRETRYSNG